jgi:predicted DNA-binding transcriptional regulator AlpA
VKTFEFSIIASGLDPEAEDFADRFFNAGCDDATISFQKGHIVVDFARDAESLEDAIASAVEAVNKTGAKVDRVEPDPLVSLADMAARTGMTRSAMTHYSQGKRAKDFPTPIAKVTSESPLWDWATVAKWMYQNKKLELEVAVAAEIVKQANEAICKGEVEIGAQLRQRAKEYSAELEDAA